MGGYRDFYWDYYSESRPRRVEGGIKTRSERGAIGETWWSKRWVQLLESFGMGTRLTRGRSYARMGQVLSIDIESGMVTAKVQGSRVKPYTIEIGLKPLGDKDWDKVTDAMADQAIFAAKLLTGEMPTNIEEAFSAVKLSLFPQAEHELDTYCSCPDWANPCKHIAAVYYILAERFDADPFLIFKLRGRTKEQIIATLREKRAATLPADEPQETDTFVTDTSSVLEENLATFWLAGEALDHFSVNPAPPDIDKAVLKRLGASPFTVSGKNVTTLLEKVYNTVGVAVKSEL